MLFISSLSCWGISFYYSRTQALPDFGGEYIEGNVGQPLRINPLLSASNDVDADLAQIIYDGLLKYNEKGAPVPNLAESYEINENKTVYTFHLRKTVLWHDGEPFTASDVLFTFNLITDPAYKSPLRANWQGVKMEMLDDYTLVLTTETPYAGFLNNATFGILPKHIWELLKPENFNLSELNLEPIGTGPFKYNSFQKDSKGNILSYKLTANPNYFSGKPYLAKLSFNFYSDEASALDAYNRKEVMGINSLSTQNTVAIKNQSSSVLHKFFIPRYFAVFFNQTKNAAIADDKVREALNYATNREEIIQAVLNGSGQPVYSPILSDMPGYSADLGKADYDLEKAKSLLDSDDWKMSDNGFRVKNDKPLEINLITIDWDELAKTAEIIKSQWEKVGVKVNVNNLSISDIQQNYIRPREYEALLFGQIVGADPDPYSFWHSTQKKDPGLNLALFGDSDTDKLIEDGRTEFDPQKRAGIYTAFQNALFKEMPAIFLYSPQYIYPVNKNVQGINIENLITPSKRFFNIDKWFINTKRVWK